MDLAKLFQMPIIASSHGHKIDMVIYLVHFMMLALFLGWAVYFVMALWKFRSKKNPKADYTGVTSHTSSYIEAAIVVAEIVLLLGFSIPFWAEHVNAFPTGEDNIEVKVNAEQFAWNIHYPGPDKKFGRTNIEYFDKQANPMGIDPNDPNAKDDFTTINQLHLPIGQPAIIHLTSRDVMHGFALPVMRVKQDVIPGMSIPTWFTPTKTGQWEIACTQLCGLGHYRMRGFLTIHSQEDYKTWLEEQAADAGAQGKESTDDFWL
jgi:cytochrome c oxidase subunit II